MRKAGVDPSRPPIIDDEVSFVPSKGWAEILDPSIKPSNPVFFRTRAFPKKKAFEKIPNYLI